MKITCSRCLAPAAVEAAMGRLAAEGLTRVPYTCRVSSRREQILLIGDSLAARLAALMPEAEDTADARMLAGLSSSELCECDVATLTGLADDEVISRLRALTDKGLLASRKLQGMRYFHLDCEDTRRRIEALTGRP